MKPGIRYDSKSIVGHTSTRRTEGRENRLVEKDGSAASELVGDFLEVSRIVARTRHHTARDAGVTAFQYGAILKIFEMRSVAVGALAASLSVSSQFVSSQVARLEAVGLVRRRPKENDMRGRMIALTRRGRELALRSDPTRRAADELIFRGATAEEVSSFRKVMGIMRQNCLRSSDRPA
ncbi:MarR family transcriptional regulator [Rhodopseudomonas boonkerdii]|uniref:MarR family winged helix-turn-helix transcriptional regulator n=1 Tax=Rhodopseudomonas boonkerdii TaxID=475937 RepID=UPI003D30F0B8|nr:MarR family transcriptional regulator [Rhodopseudomonas boonkerdii]